MKRFRKLPFFHVLYHAIKYKFIIILTHAIRTRRQCLLEGPVEEEFNGQQPAPLAPADPLSAHVTDAELGAAFRTLMWAITTQLNQQAVAPVNTTGEMAATKVRDVTGRNLSKIHGSMVSRRFMGKTRENKRARTDNFEFSGDGNHSQSTETIGFSTSVSQSPTTWNWRGGKRAGFRLKDLGEQVQGKENYISIL